MPTMVGGWVGDTPCAGLGVGPVGGCGVFGGGVFGGLGVSVLGGGWGGARLGRAPYPPVWSIALV